MLRDLIYYRETFEIKEFIETLKKEVFEKEKKFFEVWMAGVNENIQNLAESFAERFFLQNAWVAYEKASQGSNLKLLLRKIIRLHMIDYLKRNLGWYLSNEIISKEGAITID